MTFLMARTDTSIIGRWWWTVDRWLLAAALLLLAIGIMLAAMASPAVAVRIGLPPLHFVERQMVFSVLALIVLVAISLLDPLTMRRLAIVGFAAALLATALTLVIGPEIKGAQRWLSLPGFSLQPSEFLKPTFAVVSAWLLAEAHRDPAFPGRRIVAGLFAVIALLLVAQPDMGMTVIVAAVWVAQLFVAGLPMVIIVAVSVLGLVAAIGAYWTFDHVSSRIDRFLDPASGDTFQVDTGLSAFMAGGLFGRGPGEGSVKDRLPDAHSDFIFAVAGEELGMFAALIIIGLFALVVLRGFARASDESSPFVQIATTGLLVGFGLQAIVNMASTLHLMPTKGMTLPFVSYGGSSMLAVAFTIGMLLALTRRRRGGDGTEAWR
ncbi:MAG: putative peptidoglycan glycosyltransferase FtsW [Alphaproteobacteria bacterium]